MRMKIFFFSCLVLLFLSASVAQAYKNYTVGDSLGWYDNLQKPSVNYQKWVAGKSFSLGDFLMFNTDSNHSVVQTYNFTTYKQCAYDDAEIDDTIQWSEAEPSAATPRPITVPVPLLKEGMSYFFSGNYDGEQCKHGQRFKVNVTRGEGLPEVLKDPSTQAPSPTSQDDDSTPNQETTVSSDFSHPKESGADADDGDDDNVKKTSGSVSLGISVMLVGLLGAVWIC